SAQTAPTLPASNSAQTVAWSPALSPTPYRPTVNPSSRRETARPALARWAWLPRRSAPPACVCSAACSWHLPRRETSHDTVSRRRRVHRPAAPALGAVAAHLQELPLDGARVADRLVELVVVAERLLAALGRQRRFVLVQAVDRVLLGLERGEHRRQRVRRSGGPAAPAFAHPLSPP